MTRMLVCGLVCGVVVALSGACGSEVADETAQVSDTDPAPTKTVDGPDELVEPDAAMRKAVRRLVSDRTGSFTTELDLGGSGRMEVAGIYDLVLESSQQTVDLETPNGPLSLESVGGPDDVWFRFVRSPSVENGKCWIHLDADALSGATEFDAPVVSTLGLPAAVLVAGHARGLSWTEPGRILRSTTDLHVLAKTAGQLADSLGIDPKSTDRVELDVLLDKGRITGWEASLGDLVDAAEASGSTLPEEIERSRALLDDLEVVASIGRPAQPVSVDRPDPRKVVDAAVADADVNRDLTACEARWAATP